MSIQTQKERLELAKYNWRVAFDYVGGPAPYKTDSFFNYIDYLSNVRFCEIPVEFDYPYGYVDGNGWHYEDNGGVAKNPIDIYAIKKDHNYYILRGADSLGATRFRVCTVNVDIREKTSGTYCMQALLKQDAPTQPYATLIYGVSNTNRYKNPDYNNALTPFFRAADDGWLLIQKSNTTQLGLSCFVFDLGVPVPQITDPILDESLFDIDSNGVITLKSSVDKDKITGDRIVPDTVDGVTVTGIGNNCFEECYGLNSIEFPSTVTSIGDYAFHSTGLLSFTFPSTVTSVGEYAFSNCRGLTSITVPSTVTSLGDYAFRYCIKLESATVNASITRMYGTFYDCQKLASVTMPSNLLTIDYCFYSAGIMDLPVMTGITHINERAFFNAHLVNVVIPNSVTYLSYHSFRYCDHMISIIVPSSVTSMASSAITMDRLLQWVEFQGTTPPTIAEDNVPFLISTNNCPIYVPDAAVNAYKTASVWSTVADRIVSAANRQRPVGGTLFYIDNDASGTYTFYDANGDVTSAPTVGTDCTGWTYTVTDADKDKYYVYDSTTGRVFDKTWGYNGISTNTGNSSIGAGRLNTGCLESTEDTSSNPERSIFYYLFNTQNAGQGTNGCKDWYIGSRFEVRELVNSNLEPTWFDNSGPVFMWSSTQVSATSAYNYTNYHDESVRWSGFVKDGQGPNMAVCFFRSF